MYRRYSYYGTEKHERRNAFLGLIRTMLVSLREIPLILFVLKLCGVTNIGWIVIIAVYVAWHLADYILDLINISVDEKDKKEKEVRYSDRIRE